MLEPIPADNFPIIPRYGYGKLCNFFLIFLVEVEVEAEIKAVEVMADAAVL